MTQELNDHASRLRAMIGPAGQQTWDLSPNDVKAITLAVRVLSVIEHCDKTGETIESYNLDLVVDSAMLQIGFDREFYGKTLLECFDKAGGWLP